MGKVDFDPSHQGSRDLAGIDPVEVTEAVSDLRGEVPELAHDHGEFALGLRGFGHGAPLVLELGDA